MRCTRRRPGFSSPPAGVVLETADQIVAQAGRIKTVVVDEGDAARKSDKMTQRGARRGRRLGRSGRHAAVGCLHARDRRRRLSLLGAPRGVGGAADRRCVPPPAAARVEDHPRPLERRGGWIPFGDLDLGLGPENATCYPNPGEIVLYPGGVSETEILLAYGYVNFASKAGQLAGNHFATVVEGNENLRELGRKFLWEGAQEIVFREA